MNSAFSPAPTRGRWATAICGITNGPCAHCATNRILLLEIGVAEGASLRIWETYFQRASIVGIDINEGARKHATQRCKVEIGSQGDPAFLRAIAAKYAPDVIIDDGSHRADHILLTFEHLWPTLRPGGVYIVEDVQFHAGPYAHESRGTAKEAPQQCFLRIAGGVACPFDRVLPEVDSVEFVHSAIILRKAPVSDRIALVPAIRTLVERANLPQLWLLFTGYLLNSRGDPAEALAAAQKAVDLDPARLTAHHTLSMALDRAGDLAGAIEAEKEAVRRHAHMTLFRDRLADLEKRLAAQGH